jgi:hypothetical protein
VALKPPVRVAVRDAAIADSDPSFDWSPISATKRGATLAKSSGLAAPVRPLQVVRTGARRKLVEGSVLQIWKARKASVPACHRAERRPDAARVRHHYLSVRK